MSLRPRLCRTCVRLIFALGAWIPAVRSAESLEERLAALEKRLGALEAENATLRRQVGSAETPLVTAAGKETKLAIGGFVHLQHEAGGPIDARYVGINDRFQIRRLRPFVSGVFTENVSFKFEADFGNNAIAPRTGASGQLTDAFVSWTKFPEASVRLGQFKSPFGFEQLTSDAKLFTVERSLANDRLTLGRQIGAMVFGDVVPHRIGYSVAAFNGTGTNFAGNDNHKFLWVARATANTFERMVGATKLHLANGVNYFATEDKGTLVGRRTGWGLDAQFTAGPAEVQVEWLRNELHPFVGRATNAEGWSAFGGYALSKRLQAHVRFETFDQDLSAPRTTTQIWTLGFNYYLKGDDLKLTVNYLLGNPPAPAGDEARLMTRVQVMF